jgi:outer membrane protein assembly factor BamB
MRPLTQPNPRGYEPRIHQPNMKLLIHSLLIAFASTFLAALRAENWPGFRGPTGQGLSKEKGLPLHWSADSNVLWKAAIPGDGWSSPIVWEDRVFVSTTTENGTKCRVLCLDAKKGAVLWDKQVFEQVPRRKEGKNSFATPTPVTDGKRVYVVFGDGSVVALDLSGTVLWTNREVEFYSRHGLGASPVLHDGLLIMPYDGSNRTDKPGQYPNNTPEERLGWQLPWDKSFIAALDVKTGKRVWTGKRGLSRIAHMSPVVMREGSRQVILSAAGDVVQAFDPKSGEQLWSVYSQGEGVVPTPVTGGGLVFASSGFEKTTLRAIRPGGRGDVTTTHIAWEQKKGAPTQPSLLYANELLFAITDGGIATCYQPKTGEQVWQERVGGNFCASPVWADGRIYFLSEAGETTVIEAADQFKVMAKNSLGEKCQASMAVSGGRLFIRSDKSLFCIGR